jgi:hypothetical protein
VAESPVRERRQAWAVYPTGFVHVTLEIWGEKFTSTVGPLSDDEGWAVFQAFIADMKRLKPTA